MHLGEEGEVSVGLLELMIAYRTASSRISHRYAITQPCSYIVMHLSQC